MAILVNLPDGSQASFPDGTSPEVMKAAIQKRFSADQPPAGAVPGSREYADWAAARARGGNALPQIPGSSPTAVVPPQQAYDAAFENLRKTQYPGMSPDEFKKMSGPMGFEPAGLGDMGKNSLTLSAGDEISSALGAAGSQIQNWMGNENAPGFGEAFGNYQRLEDARFNLGREQQGLPGAIVEGGAGLFSMGPERAAVEAAARGIPQLVKAAPSLLKTVLSSGATGGVLGTIAGFNSSQGDLAHRAVGAGLGGVGGVAVGSAFPVVARGVSAAIDNIGTALVAKDAAKKLGISPETAKFVQSRLAADDSLSPAGLQRMGAAGSEATLADAGPSARNALDYAIQSSGTAGNTARELIGARVGRDSAAITDVLDATLGKPKGAETARAEIRTTTAPARGSAYDTAYAQPIDYASPDGRQLEELLQRVPKQAIDRANALMKIKGEKSGQIMAQVADDGSITFKTMPDVRQLDYITRGLNEEAQHGLGAGAMGGQTTLGSALEGLSTDIRDTLRLHVPAYGDALAVGKDAIRQSQAVQNGYELLRPGTTREQVASWAGSMTPADRTAAAQGIRSHISDTISNVSRTLTDGDVPAREALKVLRDLSTTASREKVAAVIGKQKADQLFAELDRATKSFELKASVADNSKTFQRQEMNRQVDAVASPNGIIPSLMRGEPVNAGKRGLQAFTGMTEARGLAAKDEMMQEVANLLLQRGPQATDAAQVIQSLGTSRQGISQIAQMLIGAGRVSGPAAYLTGQRSGQRPQ
jgi:hypothetical protein